jgi:hypothetical protein
MQYNITRINAPQNVSHAVLPDLAISETKHTDVQTNGACNVPATFRCLIQAVRLALCLPVLHMTHFSVYIFTHLNRSTNTCVFVQFHEMNELH